MNSMRKLLQTDNDTQDFYSNLLQAKLQEWIQIIMYLRYVRINGHKYPHGYLEGLIYSQDMKILGMRHE